MNGVSVIEKPHIEVVKAITCKTLRSCLTLLLVDEEGEEVLRDRVDLSRNSVNVALSLPSDRSLPSTGELSFLELFNVISCCCIICVHVLHDHKLYSKT